eukprot:gene8235-14172_t
MNQPEGIRVRNESARRHYGPEWISQRALRSGLGQPEGIRVRNESARRHYGPEWISQRALRSGMDQPEGIKVRINQPEGIKRAPLQTTDFSRPPLYVPQEEAVEAWYDKMATRSCGNLLRKYCRDIIRNGYLVQQKGLLRDHNIVRYYSNENVENHDSRNSQEKTFEELLESSPLMKIRRPQGKIVSGKITNVCNDDLYVDFGGKFEVVVKRPPVNTE